MIEKLSPLLKKAFFVLAVLLCSLAVFAQESTVTIRATNSRKEPLAFASITVTSRLDSNKIITKAADSTGSAKFVLSKGKQYSVLITAVNYRPIEKGFIASGNNSTLTYVAEPSGKTMETAVITSKKPLMRQEDDKTIIDPENLVAASTSGYEVIEKTPGLFVDQDGNIYISSLTPATVQINGRELKMSNADIATMLKSLPPNAISKIEVVRTPSANTDANSSGGVVNVVLKKGVKIGLTGSVTMGMQQGTFGNQFAGFNLNNNDGKKSYYINVNISHRDNYEKIATSRLFGDTSFSQAAYTRYPSMVYFTSYGYVYELNNKWSIDFAGSASLNDYKNKSENNNVIRNLISSSSTPLSSDLNNVTNDGSSFYSTNAVQTKLKIDSLGSQWTTDLYYSFSRNQSDQLFNTQYTIPVILKTGGDGETDGRRQLFSFQSDLKKKLAKKLTVEAGVKSTLLRFNNVAEYFKDITGIRSKDPGRTNTFRYRENINAAYVQASKTLGKDAVLKLGVRLENTNMNGRQLVPGDTTFDLHRTDLFPYVYLSKNIMKIMGYSLRGYLVYRRTISRPVYEQLNPFPKYIDQYLSEIGNPSLRPQFTQNIEANVSVDEQPILAVGLNNTRDIFSIVTYQADTGQAQAYRTYENLGRNKEWYLRGMGALPPGGRYFFVLGAQFNYNIYEGLYEGKPLSFKKGTWTFFTYHNLKLDKRSQLTLNGFIRLRGQQQLYELESFGSLNSSVNRKFFKEKLVVTLSANDIFRTNINEFAIRQGTVNATGLRQADTRRFGINLRYIFGIRKREENNGMFNVDGQEKTN
ncbi:MAG: outer membrane beta-barrel family protein [Bacteroidetes bacterium]|nr:outer membrane beta-barrel family protein [Bacteroidota bacterium]